MMRARLHACGFVLALAYACGDDDRPEAGHDHGEHDHGAAGSGEHDHGPVAMPDPAGSAADSGGYRWRLPPSFPRPPVPADNPMSEAKVELGRHLFYDERLSKNETFACASCHEQERAFADERATGLGSTGQAHSRGSMSLANVAYSLTLTWGNPLMTDLETQAQVPIFGDAPIELGMTSVPEVEERFRRIPRYAELFAAAFPDDAQPLTMLNLLRALSAFERTLISGDSPFDRYSDRGEEAALSEAALRGMRFVMTNEDHRFECNHCHGGFNFSDHVTWEGLDRLGAKPPYHQTGLYDRDGKGGYPEPNTGVYSVTLDPNDMGKFKAPTLRNIAVTAPYMHDGSIETLADVLDHYAKGGRAHHAGKTDALLAPFEISDGERADIIAFLESLTDAGFLSDPRFADPGPL
jgi:cytochrome c peroxidase